MNIFYGWHFVKAIFYSVQQTDITVRCHQIIGVLSVSIEIFFYTKRNLLSHTYRYDANGTDKN